jgi:hypothetical protein
MAYVTAVTNRTAASFWNVADWARVYGNSQLVSALAEIELGSPIAFTSLTAPTITTIPAVADFNLFLANIENIRVAVVGESIPGTLIAIKDDWEAGPDKTSLSYGHANLWESTLDAIWSYYNGASLPVCPILSSDLTITTGNTYIVVDCLDANGFNITIQDGATLAIIP